MNRGYIKQFGSIKEYNISLAKSNLNEADADLKAAMEGYKAALEEAEGETPSSLQMYRLDRAVRKLNSCIRVTEQAVEDYIACMNGLFPSDIGIVQKITHEDPRDWFFKITSIGDCHDCPLHAGLGNCSSDTLPCGAKKCVVWQLCKSVGKSQ